MPKLFEYENILSGKKESITDVWGLFSKILGVVVIFFVIATGQNVAGRISSKIPALDTTIDPITKQPTSTGPVRRKVTL